MWRLPRLTLIFWLPSLRTLICVVFYFVTVITHDLTYILLLLFSSFLVSDLCRIDSSGWGDGIPLVLILFLFLILPGLIFVRRGILNGGRHGCLIPRFVPTMIFHRSLSLDFVCGSVSGSTSSENLYISLLYKETWS